MYTGKSLSVVRNEDGIAELILDAEGAVNLLNTAPLEELAQAVEALKNSTDITGLLIHSKKKQFVLGADVFEFPGIFKQPTSQIIEWNNSIHKIFTDIEELPFPTAAAVNGMALGGGLELALSADFRVADPACKVALPEVTFGICPGWGGTTRLSRLLGPEIALDWILTGKPRNADTALEQGAIDAIASVDDLTDTCRQLLGQAARGELDFQAKRDAKRKPIRTSEEEALPLINSLQEKYGPKIDPRYPAPKATLSLVFETMTKEFDEALKRETATIAALGQSNESSNLIQLFSNEQLLKKKTRNWVEAASGSVDHVAVVGAGIMGGGIASQAALRNIPVVLKDIDQAALDLGMTTAESLVDRSIKRGHLDADKKQAVVGNVQPSLEYENFSAVDYVVEAVVERIDVKNQVLADVESRVNPNAVLASNTSTISINELAEGLERPENFCGMHFFNPVHAMKLVEVVQGSKTSEQTVAATVAFAVALGKTPIVVQDCPGFLVNRILFPYFNGFNRLLVDGVDFERVDQLMEDFGWPMGPAYLADVIGLDTMVHADKVMEAGFPQRMGHDKRPIIEVLYEGGALGQKNGTGFYEYSRNSDGTRVKNPSAAATAALEPYTQKATELTDEAIVDRLMIPMCLEAARCLDDGIAETAAEVDTGLALGLGFPRFHGGALKYIDTIGIDAFAKKVEAFSHLGPLYELSDKFKDRVAQNKTFF